MTQDLGAPLRPHSWRLSLQTIGSEYWSSRGAWTKTGDFEGSTGVLRNPDAMSDTAISHWWIWLMRRIQVRKKNPNLNFWVRYFLVGWGSSTWRGGGQKVQYVPRNPGNQTFLAGYPGILPGYPGSARKVWEKNVWVQFLSPKNEFEGRWLRGWNILVIPSDDLLESLCTDPTFEFAFWARTYDPSWFNDWSEFSFASIMTIRTNLSEFFFCDCWLDLICWICVKIPLNSLS